MHGELQSSEPMQPGGPRVFQIWKQTLIMRYFHFHYVGQRNVWKGLNRYKNPEDIEYAISFLVSVLPSAPMKLRMITPWETSSSPWKMIFEFDSASFERMVPCQERGDTLEVYKSLQTHGASVVSLLLTFAGLQGRLAPSTPCRGGIAPCPPCQSLAWETMAAKPDWKGARLTELLGGIDLDLHQQVHDSWPYLRGSHWVQLLMIQFSYVFLPTYPKSNIPIHTLDPTGHRYRTQVAVLSSMVYHESHGGDKSRWCKPHEMCLFIEFA